MARVSSLVIGGAVAAAFMVIMIAIVAGVIYQFRDVAGTVLRDYKLRHPEMYGPQPDLVPWYRGLFRRNKKVGNMERDPRPGSTVNQADLSAQVQAEAGEMSEKDGGIVVMKVAGKKDDGHSFIPLRDEAFGGSFAEDTKQQEARMLKRT